LVKRCLFAIESKYTRSSVDELTNINNQKHPQGTGSQVQGTKAYASLASATIAMAMATVKRIMVDVRALLWIVE